MQPGESQPLYIGMYIYILYIENIGMYCEADNFLLILRIGFLNIINCTNSN